MGNYLLASILVLAVVPLMMYGARADHVVRKGRGGTIVYDRAITPEKRMLVTAELWAKELAVASDEARTVAETPWERRVVEETQVRALALA